MTQMPTPVPVLPPAPVSYEPFDPSRRNAPATASLVCALLVFIPFVTGFTAIALGQAGLRRAVQIGGRGRGMARAGIILGVVNIGLWLLASAAAVPVFARARANARQVQCMSNLRQLGMAMFMYSAEWKGAVPPDLDVVQKYLGSAQPNFCPEAAANRIPPASVGALNYSYVYLRPASPVTRLAQIKMPTQTVAAFEPLANHGGRGIAVLYWDGHVEWHSGTAAQALVAKLMPLQAGAARTPPEGEAEEEVLQPASPEGPE